MWNKAKDFLSNRDVLSEQPHSQFYVGHADQHRSYRGGMLSFMVFSYVFYLASRNGVRLVTLHNPDIKSITKALSADDEFYTEQITLNDLNKMYIAIVGSDH